MRTFDPKNINDVARVVGEAAKQVHGIDPYAKSLGVRHDIQPENEIVINADCWCDIGSHKVPEWNIQNVRGDVSVCVDCYEHFT